MGYNKILFVLLGLLLLGSGLVMAISNAQVTSKTDLTRWVPTATPGNVTTEGGNISQVAVSANTLTDRWAGFFGPVTGDIYLTDNGNKTDAYLYMWTTTSAGGWVCVSTNSTYDFTAATTTTKEAIDGAWGFGAVPDNATNTFTGTTCTIKFYSPAENTITNTIYALHQSNSTFRTCAIGYSGADAEEEFAFCSAINQSGKNYANQTAAYELIVPTTVGDVTETYYFYVEFQ